MMVGLYIRGAVPCARMPTPIRCCGAYRNLLRELCCMPPVDREPETRESARSVPPPPPQPAPPPVKRLCLVICPDDAMYFGLECTEQ